MSDLREEILREIKGLELEQMADFCMLDKTSFKKLYEMIVGVCLARMEKQHEKLGLCKHAIPITESPCPLCNQEAYIKYKDSLRVLRDKIKEDIYKAHKDELSEWLMGSIGSLIDFEFGVLLEGGVGKQGG